LDANVLIDYAKTDPSVLGLVSRHVGPVVIPSELLGEVRQLEDSTCERLGLRVVQASLEQLLAAAQRRGRLSFQDHLCLIMAREEGWTCVSNDRQLRAECGRQQVPVRWGLELLLELVSQGVVPVAQALDMAQRVQESNRFITPDVVSEFGRKVRALKVG
jgi:hypothetical protein